MYSSEVYSLKASDRDIALKKGASLSSFLPSALSLNKKKKNQASLNFSLLITETSHVSQKKPAQSEEFLLDILYVQARKFVSLIEDPLWKNICSEVIKIMGPLSVLKIWESCLGAFAAQDPLMEIHCKNEDTAQFFQQYAFVILGNLQNYFPSIKCLKIKIN